MRRLLFTILLLSGLSAFSQDPIQVRTYGGPANDFCKEIIEVSDGFLLFGSTASSAGVNTSEYLVKVDYDLNHVWTRNYGAAFVDIGTSIVAHPTSGYVLLGHTNSYGEEGYNLSLRHIDDAGEEIQHNFWSTGDWDLSVRLKPLLDEGFVVASNSYGGGLGAQDIMISRVDLDLELVWQLPLGSTGFDEVGDIHVDESGFIYVVGTTTTAQGPRGICVKLDDSGAVQWQEVYGDSETRIYGCELDANGLIFVGGYEHDPGEGLDHFVSKFSFEGELLWERLEFNGGEEALHELAIIESGMITTGKTNTFGVGWTCMIQRRTPSGWWSVGPNVGLNGDEEGRDVIWDSTGRVIVVGETNSFTDNMNMDMMLLMYENHEFGQTYELEFEGYLDVYLGVEDIEKTAQILAVADGIQISTYTDQWREVSVFNLTGQLVHRDRLIRGLNEIRLPNGMYIVKLQGEKHFHGEKVLVH